MHITLDRLVTNVEGLADNAEIRFDFKLNKNPDPEWRRLFNSHFNDGKVGDPKKLGIEADKLWVVCDKRALPAIYLPRINAAIDEANRVVSGYEASFNQDQAKKRAKEDAERAEQDAFLASLKKPTDKKP